MVKVNMSRTISPKDRLGYGERIPVFAYAPRRSVMARDGAPNVTETPGSPYIAAPKSAQDEGALVETIVRILGGKIDQADLQAVIDAVTGRDNAAALSQDIDIPEAEAKSAKVPGMDRKPLTFADRWPHMANMKTTW